MFKLSNLQINARMHQIEEQDLTINDYLQQQNNGNGEEDFNNGIFDPTREIVIGEQIDDANEFDFTGFYVLFSSQKKIKS